MKLKPKTKVKWTYRKQTHFGIIIGPQLKDGTKADKNCLFVEDATRPRIYEVEKKDLIRIRRKKPKYNKKTKRYEGDEFYNHVMDEYLKVRAKQQRKNLYKDKLFYVGNASYLVTKVNKKTVDVEWRAFTKFRKPDSLLKLGGRFPKSIISTLASRNSARV